MAEHVDEGAQRGEELTTIQPMVSTTPPGKKMSHAICINERLIWTIIINHVLLTLFVVIVDAPVV